jgi:hypothetical protein
VTGCAADLVQAPRHCGKSHSQRINASNLIELRLALPPDERMVLFSAAIFRALLLRATEPVPQAEGGHHVFPSYHWLEIRFSGPFPNVSQSG